MDKWHCLAQGSPGTLLPGFRFLQTDDTLRPEAARCAEGRDAPWGRRGEREGSRQQGSPLLEPWRCHLPCGSPREAFPSQPAGWHRSQLVRAIRDHCKGKSIKNPAELSLPRASAVP